MMGRKRRKESQILFLVGGIIAVRRGGVEKDIPTAPPFPIHLKVGKLEGEYRKPLLFFGKNGEVDAMTRFDIIPLRVAHSSIPSLFKHNRR